METETYPFAPITVATLVKRQRHASITPGDKIGRLTVLERASSQPGGQHRWKCRCECGTEVAVLANNLRYEYTRSCGCYWRDLRTQTAESMLVTARHGKLRFIREVEPTIRKQGRRDRNGLFVCDCGNETVANLRNVRRGLTKSCGCTLSVSLKAAFKAKGTKLPGI